MKLATLASLVALTRALRLESVDRRRFFTAAPRAFGAVGLAATTLPSARARAANDARKLVGLSDVAPGRTPVVSPWIELHC